MTPLRPTTYFFIAFFLSCILPRDALAQNLDLLWSTFLGGSDDDYAYGIAVDDSGCVLLAGQSESLDFPSRTADSALSRAVSQDVFVARLNPSGDALYYVTFIGGSDRDEVTGLAVDTSGNTYVTGTTSSADFPTTMGTFDITLDGSSDIFLAKFNPAGSILEYATYLGGSSEEDGGAITVDDAGRPAMTGSTTSDDFPFTLVAFDTTHNGSWDALAAKFTTWGGALELCTYLGGYGNDYGYGIAVDQGGNVYVTGRTESPNFPTTGVAFDTSYNGGQRGDAFITKVHLTGSVLSYSTFLGGGGDDDAHGIALQRDGSILLAGYTSSADFPITSGAIDTSLNDGEYDAFVARLNPTGGDLTYGTYLGGADDDYAFGIVLGRDGRTFLTGVTESEDFPTTLEAFDRTWNGNLDIFVACLDISENTYDYGTFLGGAGGEYNWRSCIATDDSGNAYVTGFTFSEDFPTTPGTLDDSHNGGLDLFVVKLGPDDSTPVDSPAPASTPPMTPAILQNHPNPFNDHTELRYRILSDGSVTLKVFNALGQQVRTLVDGPQEAGDHTIIWDGRDDHMGEVASGMYFCRLGTNGLSKSIKMMLVK